MELSDHPRRLPQEPNPVRFRSDGLYSCERTSLYDRISRNLYPHYREAFRLHENELTRFNRRRHNLNFPCCAPKAVAADESTPLGTPSATISSQMTSTERRRHGYKSSYRRQQQIAERRTTLQQQLLERASKGEFANKERITLEVIRALQRAGCDMATIQLALENVTFKFSVDLAASELRIDLQFA
jgi:hypothetical protein